MFTLKKRRKLVFVAAFAAVLSFILLSGAEGASSYKNVKGGNELFNQGQYDAAIEEYEKALEKDPESDIIRFDLGTARYKAEEYDQSIEQLEKVLLSENELLKQKTYHNLGNAYYKRGILEEEYDLNYAVEQLKKSLNYFESALKIGEDKDAEFNYAFVKKEIERLKLQQQQQQQQNQDKEQQDSKDDQESSQDKGKNQKGEDQKKQDSQTGAQDQKESEGENQSSEVEQSTEKEQKDGESGEDEEDQEKEDQDKREGDSKKDQSEGAQEPRNGQSSEPKEGELSQMEAQMLLDNYQQSEEPKGLLKIQTGVANTQPVLKDW